VTAPGGPAAPDGAAPGADGRAPAGRPTALQVALRLGRVSNLPTVWTNVLAGMALATDAGGALHAPVAGVVALALSLFYVGGMYLNDAFDHRWDAAHRRERPIPAGLVRPGTVYAAGFALLAAGLALLAWQTRSREAAAAGAALAALIVAYDAFHKRNPLAPLLMGLCRVGVYVIAALAVVARPPPAVYAGAGVLLVYLVLLSTVARKETLHARLPALVGVLIAGIALLDAAILALTRHFAAAALAVGAFLLTRHWQRSVPGT
jgi:4-hydroxybenzoate polyprenyltransferase